MKSKSLIIGTDDLPSTKDIIDTISRLKRDYELLSRIKGSRDIENPESFRNVIGFLEMILKREKRNLPKEPDSHKEIFKVLFAMLSDHLMLDETPSTTTLIEETKLGEWARKYAAKSNID